MSKYNNNNNNNNNHNNQNDASKFSNYVNNGKYVTIYEGKTSNIVQKNTTPTTITITFETIGRPISNDFFLVNSSDPTDTYSFSATQSPYTIQGLRKNTTYNVTITASYASKNAYSTFLKRGLKTINEGPAFDVDYFDITNNSARLVFSNNFGVPNTVQLTITNATNPTDIQVVPNVSSNYIIRNLERNARYNVELKSVFISSGNIYIYFLQDAITTLNEDPPIFLQVSNIRNNGVTIRYDVVGLPTYNILTLTNVNNNTDIYQKNVVEKTVTFDSIGVGQTYTLVITSVYTTGNRFTTTVTEAFTTLTEDMVKNISIITTTGNTVYFSFDPAIGNPTTYTVTITNQNVSFPNDIVIQDFPATIITNGLNVGNLKNNSSYSFIITSKYNYSNGNQYTTSPITVQTLNEGTITDFSIIKIENTNIRISVTNTIGDSLFYEIRARNINVPTDQVVFTSNIANTIITIPNLTINNTYILSVTSNYIRTNNRYTYTFPSSVTTLNEGPSVITSASETNKNSTNLMIYSPYGIPDNYQLYFSYLNNNSNIVMDIEGNGNANQTVFIPNLIQNTVYTVTVQNRYFNSFYQEYHTYLSTSGFLLYTKAVPTILSYGIVTDSSSSLNFTTPVFPVDNYRLIENGTILDVSSSQILLNVDPTISTLIIPDLIPNTSYDISFVFYYQDIQTDYTTFFHINTKGPVQRIDYLSIIDTSANISFVPPLVLPENYTVNISDNNRTIYAIDDTDNEFVVSGLSPNTVFSLAIATNYIDQSYIRYSTFITKDKPRNITIQSITDISASISFNALLAIPDYYDLSYNDTYTILPNTFFTTSPSSSSTKLYYTLLELIPDTLYSNLSIGAYYNDISYTFVSDIYPAFYTKSAPTNINVDAISNTTARINITPPINTIPNYYILHFIDSSISDISFSSTSTIANPSYSLVSLEDNSNFTFNILSEYISDNIRITSDNYSFQTHGTPIIFNYTNIYDTYATVNFQQLLISPTKYRISLLNINTNRTLNRDFYPSDISTNEITGFDNYTLPIDFLSVNSSYNTSLSSYYPERIYTGPVFFLDTKSSPIINNIDSTDISANVFFNYPYVRPENINYSILFNNILLFTNTNVPIFKTPELLDYFTVPNLIQNRIYTIITTSVYTSDISYNFDSVPFTFQTQGPPTNLTVSNRNISNTQFIINFDLPYNTRNYTAYVTDIAASTVLTYNIIGISVSPYKIIDLSENTLYSAYVTSNYTNNKSYSSNTVQVTTLSGLQIQNLQNITDTRLEAIINAPTLPPTFFSYNIQSENGTLSPDYPITQFINIDNTNTTKLTISGLSPNTKYIRFSVNEYYLGTDATLVSNNVPFTTQGISNVTNFITDISASFTFPIPFKIPLNYYYRYGSDFNYYPVSVQTIGLNNNTFTISDLSANTVYDSFVLYMQYNVNNNPDNYIVLALPFITKQIPIIRNTIITDTTINVSFTSIIATVSRYSYTIQAENGILSTVNFTPTQNPSTGLSNFTITNLITNMYYFQFQINVFYSDIQLTYSSLNRPFNTLGPVFNPRIALSSSDPNRNSLTFYPPRSKPEYYLITNPYDTSIPISSANNTRTTIVYDTSMTFFGNQYFYDLSNVSIQKGYNGIDVVPFFSNSFLESTFSNRNFVKNLNIRISSGLIDLATNQLGNYISVCEDVNIYISSNSGNTWTTNIFNTNISKVTMDASGKNQYALYSGNPSFVYVSNNYGSSSSWVRKSFLQGNRLSSIATDISGQTVFVGGFGGAFNYISNDFGNTWTIDADTQHSENSIDCIMNDVYIYTINDINNSIIQISKSWTTGSSYISIIIPTFIPKFIVSNRENTRLITAGVDGIYISNDGISWTRTMMGYSWLSLKCDTDCIRAVAIANGIGVFITEDGGLNWNVILPVSTTISWKQVSISGDGKIIYVYDTNQNFYSYRIPDTKGNVRRVTATTVTNNSMIINAFPPTFLPNYVFDISAINRIAPNDIVSVSSNTIQNVLIPGLTADGSYNVVITTNYAYPPQSFVNTPFSIYTNNYPSNFQSFGNPTDISAVFQFQPPKSTPTNYFLQDSSGLYEIIDYPLTNNNQLQYTLNGLIPNTFYPNLKLSSYYTDISTAYTSIESVSFFTRGPVIDLSINTLLDISLNLSFRAPPNTTDISSNAYTIIATNTVSPLETKIYYSSGNTFNIPIDGLSPDGSYNIIVTTNYENPIQNLVSTRFSTYTKSAPIGVRAEPNYTTDTSGILQFQPPKILPDYYILDVSNVYTDISLSNVFLQDGSSSIIYNSFLPNTQYLSNIYLISYYANTNSRLYSIPIPSVITEGPPSVNSVTLDISNGAVLSFTPPYVFPTTVRFQIYDNTLNILYYDFSQSTTEDISMQDLSYNIIYSVVPSSIYPNKIIPGTPFLFTSRSPPLNFQTNTNQTTDSSVSTSFVSPLNIPSRYEMIIINNNTRIFSLANTLNSFIIDDLSANVYYSLTLQSLYDIPGYINTPLRLSTNIIQFYTKGPARNIVIDSLTDTQTLIFFDNPFIPPTQFILVVQNQDPAQSSDSEIYNNINSPVQLTDLTPNSTYLITIQSVYVNMISSTNFTIITQGSPTILSTDINVTDHYATIPFLACPNIPNFYDLVLRYSNGTVARTVRNTPAIVGTAFLVQELSSNTAYSVTISAIYGVGNGATIYTSVPVLFNTLSAVINVQTPADTITSTTAILTFQNATVIPPNPYRITINNQTKPTIPTVNNPNHVYSVPLTDLTPDTFYNARIDSVFSNYVVSTNITVATEGVPRDISFNTVTDVSANIAFQPCNYIANKYELVLTKETIQTIEIKPIGLKIVSSETVAWTGGIAISTNESSLIVYNTNQKLFTKSLDSGNTWSASSAFVTTTDTIYAASFTTTGYYVYSSNNGIYYSLNAGVSWVRSNAPSGSGIAFTILKQNRAGNIVIAIANTINNPLVYSSTNYGQTWTISNSNSVLPTNVTQLQISANGVNAYILATNIYKSVDSGNTWITILDIDTNLYEISTINTFHISVDGTFLLVITDTLNTFISLDAGNTFTQTTYTIPNAVSSLFTFSMDGKYGYQCNKDGFLYYSTDYGQTWINSLISCTNPTQNTVLLKTTDSGNYAIYSDGISGIKKIYPNPVQTAKSYGVTTLTTKDIRWKDYFLYNIFSYISRNGNFLLECYVDNKNTGGGATYYNGFIYSNDFGKINTWTEILISIDNTTDRINAFCGNENGYFVYGTNNNTYISTNFGTTWNTIPALSGTSCKKLAIDETGKYILAVTQTPTQQNNQTIVIHNSINYGSTWNQTVFTSIYSIQYLSLSRDAKYGYICINNTFISNIYKSTDYGKTWTTDPIWSQPPNTLSIDAIYISSLGNFIYVHLLGDINSKLYYSVDYGQTFQMLIINLFTDIRNGFPSFSEDGKYGVQHNNSDDYLYFSDNYGVTWTNSQIIYDPFSISAKSKIQMSDDGTFVLGIISEDLNHTINNIVRIDNITRSIPQTCTFTYNNFTADSGYSTYLQSVYNIHTPANIYPSITTDLITKSSPTNIQTSSDFTTVDVTFLPPTLTFPTNYTIYVYDNRYQLYKTKDISDNNNNTDISGTITDLSINTYYNVNVSSNYTEENISIVSPYVNFYTSFNPIIDSIFYTINKLNDTFTLTANYRMNKPPLYYLMKIEYPKKYLDPPTDSIPDISNSFIYIYDTNQPYFSFFNLIETGNYIVTISAVYSEYTFTLDTSTNIYVNTTVPVSLDSYVSTNTSITVNYTILDPTIGRYYLQLKNTIFPLYYSDISLSNLQSTFTYSGLIPNSGSYEAYISTNVNGGTYNSNRSIISLAYNPPAVSITDISTNGAYNAITSRYSIQNSYNTLYTIVLQNTVFDISFNKRAFYYNNSSTFSNLFYNSGSYSSYIRVKSNNTTYISNIRTVTLPYIKPIAINSVTGDSNSISLGYTLYNTYQSKYQLHIVNKAFPDICFNIPITANSNNYVFTPLPFYNLGSYYVYMDVSYVTDRYFTPLDLSASTIYLDPITLTGIGSNTSSTFNNIFTTFNILPCYQSNTTLILRNRIIPDISYTIPNISSNLVNFVFNNLFYNSGTYDVSMVMTYTGVNDANPSTISTRRFVTDTTNSSITVQNVQLISITNITKTNNSINVFFRLLRPYQAVYTLYARNTTINDLSYAITTLASTNTSYTFADLFYNSGTYNIYMEVKYKNGNNVDTTETTSEQLVTLTNISPIIVGAISQTSNSITVPYTFYPVYKGTYAIHARNTSIPALSRSIPLTVPPLSAPLISSYTFADLFVNSGSYNITMDVSYNNNSTSFSTTSQTITLVNVDPVTITAISNTTNTINVSYSFVNVYNPSYIIHVNNTSTPALSYSDNTLSVSTTNYTLRNLFYNSGTYSVFIVLSYNGSSVFTTSVSPLSPTNSTTLPTVIPITLGTVTKGVSNGFNTITVPYSLITPFYGASYTIYAMNAVSALTQTYILPLPIVSSSSYTFTGIFYNSGNYDISMVLTQDGIRTYTAPSQRVTFTGSELATIGTISYPSNTSIQVPYTILPAYNATYTLYAQPTNITVSALSHVLSPTNYSSNHTFSNLIVDSNNHNIYIVVTNSSTNAVLYTSPIRAASLPYVIPGSIISFNNTPVNYNGPLIITIGAIFQPVYNATYMINIKTNAVYLQPYFNYTKTFTDYTGTSYAFNGLFYNIGPILVSLSVKYNNNPEVTYNTSSLYNYNQFHTEIVIRTITNTNNSITVDYSFLTPLILPIYILYATHSTNPALNKTLAINAATNPTSFTISNLPYNSGSLKNGGTYSIMIYVTYNGIVSGVRRTYNTPTINTTLPQYNFLINGDFALPATSSFISFINQYFNTTNISSWTCNGSLTICLNNYEYLVLNNKIAYVLNQNIYNNNGNLIATINPNNVLLFSTNNFNTPNLSQTTNYTTGKYYLSFYYAASTSINQRSCTLDITVTTGIYESSIFSTTLTIDPSIISWTNYTTDFNIPSNGSYTLKIGTSSTNTSTIGIGSITIV